MKTARYGRMRLGRCVKKNFGYGGCAADVLSYMDRLCSGKRKCSLIVPDKTMKDMKPCSELESYLEASYECVKGRLMSLIVVTNRSLSSGSTYLAYQISIKIATPY